MKSQLRLQEFLLRSRKHWVFLCGVILAKTCLPSGDGYMWRATAASLGGGEHGSRARSRTVIVFLPGDRF